MEEVVDVGEAEPEREHQRLAVLVVALADGREGGVRGLPETFREGESVEAVRRRVAQVLLQRTAVLARPDSRAAWTARRR